VTALRCIVYVSSAAWLLSELELETLLKDARWENQQYEISGALLYNEGTFFQYIEGPEDHLARVYDKIKRSRQHRGLIELLTEPVSERRFPGWYMGFFKPSKSELLNLSSKVWWRAAGSVVSGPNAEGLQLLDVFCKSAQRL
jgi:hypothetical protein